MHLDRETYERAGLVGVPYGAKGKRGLKPRWSEHLLVRLHVVMLTCVVVKLDLNSPSMVRGKKGYDRLIYACKNVFTSELTWLFCSLSDTGKSSLTSYPLPPSRLSSFY